MKGVWWEDWAVELSPEGGEAGRSRPRKVGIQEKKI